MSPSTSHQTILSVDDSLTIRKLIENALRPAGYTVLQAANGEEGLRIAREKRPDLILLDYVLPDLRGVEFCQRLLADEATKDLPVLLISGHGSAIQELSHDCANVVDYLTKPFASNILQAVVVSAFEKAAALREAAASLPAARTTPAPAPGETGNAAQPAPVTPAPSGTALCAEKGGELRRRVFEKLVARLHPGLLSLPAWEAARGEGEPFSYYLSRLLPLDLVDELAGELVKVVPPGEPAGPSHPSPAPASTLRGSTRFVSERHVLTHLQAEGATGELRLTLPEETVTVWLEAGAIIAISSNHPRFYCAGSTFPFLQVPHAAVSAAMVAQRERSVPFFVTAADHGVRPASVDLAEVLRECGHRCMNRIYHAGECSFDFLPLPPDALPMHTRGEHRVEFSLPQLLLESYRSVKDWQHVQQVVPRLELYVGRTAFDDAQLDQLHLDGLETELLHRMDFRHTVAELQEAVDRPLFEVCRAIYCLARLDLCYLSDLPMEDEGPILKEAIDAVSSNPVLGVEESVETDSETRELAVAACDADPALPTF